MHVGKAFRNVTGILTGNPVHIPTTESERLGKLFAEENPGL